MFLKKTLLFYVLLLMMPIVEYAQQRVMLQSGNIYVSSMAPASPVLKRLSVNPLLRITIYIPAESAAVNYKNIHCTLNADAVRDIQKLDVCFTDTEPLFSPVNVIATVNPATERFDIPADVSLQPGMHYIWFSVTLKDDARMDNRVELHATQLTAASGKIQPVTENNSTYQKRIGIALRKGGDDNIHTFRIPGITQTDKGTLIAVYDIRYDNTKDLPGNIDIGINRSTDGGQTWQPMKVIMDMGAPQENNGVGDPSILFDPVTKKIWVAALWSKGNRSIAGSGPGLLPDETGQLVVASSSDDGLTWSAPQSITPQVKDPTWKIFFQGPGNGMAMQNGALVFPAQYWDEKGMPHATIVFSRDHGASWQRGTGAESNTTEAQVVETTPGTLMLSMRDNRGRYRSVATTSNMGSTWTEHFTSYHALPDPVCMASLIKARVNVKGVMKEVLFFSNPNSSSERSNITIKASMDMGNTWQPANQLLIDERSTFGYSALTKIDDNTLGLLYEGVRDLYFIRVKVSDIIK